MMKKLLFHSFYLLAHDEMNDLSFVYIQNLIDNVLRSFVDAYARL